MTKTEISTAAKKFIYTLNQYPKMYNALKPLSFQPSITWPKFHEVVKTPFCIFSTRPGLNGVDFHIERSEALALGYMHFLHSSNLHVGYVFEIPPNARVRYNEHYFLSHKPGIVFNYKISPEVPLTNQHITVYSYGEEMVMSARKQFVHEICRPG